MILDQAQRKIGLYYIYTINKENNIIHSKCTLRVTHMEYHISYQIQDAGVGQKIY